MRRSSWLRRSRIARRDRWSRIGYVSAPPCPASHSCLGTCTSPRTAPSRSWGRSSARRSGPALRLFHRSESAAGSSRRTRAGLRWPAAGRCCRDRRRSWFGGSVLCPDMTPSGSLLVLVWARGARRRKRRAQRAAARVRSAATKERNGDREAQGKERSDAQRSGVVCARVFQERATPERSARRSGSRHELE